MAGPDDRTGTLLPAPVAAPGAGLPATYADLQNGGSREVDDAAARDAITTARRSAGMSVFVRSEQRTYRLGAGLTNADWVSTATDAELAAQVSAAAASAAAAALAATTISAATWAALAATTGSFINQRATVSASDGGTHTDPVVGGSVANSGVYGWSASPAGWRRDGVVAATGAASNATTIAGTATDQFVTPAGDRAALISGFNEFGGYPLKAGAPLVAAGYGWVLDVRFSRGNPNKVRYQRFAGYHSSGNNALFQYNEAVESDGSGDAFLCSYSMSNVTLPEGVSFLPLRDAIGAVIGLLVVKIPSGTPVSPTSTGSVSTTMVRADRLRFDVAFDAEIRRQIASQHEAGFFEAPADGVSRVNYDLASVKIKDYALYGVPKNRRPYLKQLYFRDFGSRFGAEFWATDDDGVSNDSLLAKYTVGAMASFTADIAGTVMTIAGSVSGQPLEAGMLVTGATAGTRIVSGSGTSWVVNISQSVVSGALGATFFGVVPILLYDGNGALAGFVAPDFADGLTAFTLAPAPGTLATAACKRDHLIGDAALLAYFTRNQIVSPGSKKPWADTVTDPDLLKFMKSCEGFNGVPGHQYALSALIKTAAVVRMWFADLTTGVNPVAAVRWSNPDMNTLPKRIKALWTENNNPATKTGIFFNAEVDWDALPLGYNKTFTSYAAAGIHADLVNGPLANAAYNRDYGTEEYIRVGTESVADVLRYDDALPILYREYNVPTVPSPIGNNDAGPFYIKECMWSSPKHRVGIMLLTSVDGPLVIGKYKWADGFPSTFATSGRLPPYCQIQGRGPDRTAVYNVTDGSALEPTIEAPKSHKLLDVAFVNTGSFVNGSDRGSYAGHFDPASYIMDDYETNPVHIVHRNVWLVGGPNQNKRLLGGGFYGGEVFERINCKSIALNPGYSTFTDLMHDTGNTRSGRTGRLTLIGCSSESPAVPSLSIQSIGARAENILELHDCDYGNIQLLTSGNSARPAKRRRNWLPLGKHKGAINQYDAGMVVAATAAGLAFSGTAAGAFVGTPDEFNRGEVCLADDDPAVAIGLGDCSSVAKTLTVGAQTASFTENYVSTIVAGISGATMTVASVAGRPLAVGMIVWADVDNMPAALKITALGTGSGGAGTYTLSAGVNGSVPDGTTIYGAVANSVLRAAANAALTSNPIILVNISMEDAPPAHRQCTMLNNTGARIGDPYAAGPGRGIWLKRTGLNTVAPANDGDEIFGFAPRPIADGALGSVVTVEEFFVGLLAGGYTMSGANFNPITGKFGVSAGGFNAGATTKIGTIGYDGTVKRFQVAA